MGLGACRGSRRESRTWGRGSGGAARARSPPQLHCLVVGSTRSIRSTDLIPAVRGKRQEQSGGVLPLPRSGLVVLVPAGVQASGFTRPRVPSWLLSTARAYCMQQLPPRLSLAQIRSLRPTCDAAGDITHVTVLWGCTDIAGATDHGRRQTATEELWAMARRSVACHRKARLRNGQSCTPAAWHASSTLRYRHYCLFPWHQSRPPLTDGRLAVVLLYAHEPESVVKKKGQNNRHRSAMVNHVLHSSTTMLTDHGDPVLCLTKPSKVPANGNRHGIYRRSSQNEGSACAQQTTTPRDRKF